jgi:hypothetical protein
VCTLSERIQKIDRIKEQLTTMADLIHPTNVNGASVDDGNELAEEDVQLLHEAGVLQQPSEGKRKSASKHIVFVDDVDSGEQQEW